MKPEEDRLGDKIIEIDDAQVFHSLTEELIPDIQEFIKSISKLK